MSYKKQLKMGKNLEREHSKTFNKIKKYKITTLNQFTESVAKDHLKEDKNYYTKLNRLKL